MVKDRQVRRLWKLLAEGKRLGRAAGRADMSERLSEKLSLCFHGFSCGDRRRWLTAVEKLRDVGMGSQTAEHQMAGVDFEHGFAGRNETFVILAVATRTSLPGVGPFDHPAFANGREPQRGFGAGLDFDSPRGALFPQPSVQGMVVVLIVSKDDAQPRQLFGGHTRQSAAADGAAVPSSRFAAVTTTATSNPSVSTSK